MAKIWIPKSWSGNNPPASGTRVFVGGKGAGKSAYESLSTGQTKRCLQSNGRGSIFYGNVTIADPTKPSDSSDVNISGIGGIECEFIVKTNQNQYSQSVSASNSSVSGSVGKIPNMSPTTITTPGLIGQLPTSTYLRAPSGVSWSTIPTDFKSIRKISLELTNGLYVVYYVSYRNDFDSGRGVYYNLEGFYTNISANVAINASAQLVEWVRAQTNGTLCLNKTR